MKTTLGYVAEYLGEIAEKQYAVVPLNIKTAEGFDGEDVIDVIDGMTFHWFGELEQYSTGKEIILDTRELGSYDYDNLRLVAKALKELDEQGVTLIVGKVDYWYLVPEKVLAVVEELLYGRKIEHHVQEVDGNFVVMVQW